MRSAQTERLDLAGMDAPFVLCGYGTRVSHSGSSDMTDLETKNILLTGADYVLDPSAFQVELEDGTRKENVSSIDFPVRRRMMLREMDAMLLHLTLT